MKKNRLVKVLTSAALTAAMVMSMGMSALAEVTEVPVTKVVTVGEHTYAPDTTFTFELTNGDPTTLSSTKELGIANDGKKENVKVYGGSEANGGLYFESGKNTVTFKPDMAVETDGSYAGSYKNATQIKVNADAFKKPGVYHYQLSEVEGSYPGIDYDKTTLDLYAYVTSDENGNLTVANVIVVKDGQKTGGGSESLERGAVFTNDYGKNNDDEVFTLTVTKVVSGNQGDRTINFEFPVAIKRKGNGTGEEKEKFQVYKFAKGQTEGGTPQDDLTNGAPAQTYELKDGESIKIYGLTEADAYTVAENLYGGDGDGYTTTFKVGGVETNATTTEENISVTGNASKDLEIEVTNYKNVSTPTGIILSFAPYILLVAIAGVFAVSFLRKKREEF